MMRPKLRGAHAVDHVAGHVEDAVEVDADDLFPLLEGHPVKHGVARDAGVVDQHVDGAEFLGDLGAAGFAGGVVADVPLEDRDARLAWNCCAAASLPA